MRKKKPLKDTQLSLKDVRMIINLVIVEILEDLHLREKFIRVLENKDNMESKWVRRELLSIFKDSNKKKKRKKKDDKEPG